MIQSVADIKFGKTAFKLEIKEEGLVYVTVISLKQRNHLCPTGSSTTQEADYVLFKTSAGPAVTAKQVSGLRA